MKIKELEQVMKLMDTYDMNVVAYHDGDFKVKLHRKMPANITGAQFPAQAPVMTNLNVEPAPQSSGAVDKEESDAKTITSPFVGVFYRSPSPDSGPYVKVGDRVSKGQVLCIVEAMKLMNEIESEHDGVIKEICIENATPVEFKQKLFVIE